jgi:hypothetical protein
MRSKELRRSYWRLISRVVVMGAVVICLGLGFALPRDTDALENRLADPESAGRIPVTKLSIALFWASCAVLAGSLSWTALREINDRRRRDGAGGGDKGDRRTLARMVLVSLVILFAGSRIVMWGQRVQADRRHNERMAALFATEGKQSRQEAQKYQRMTRVGEQWTREMTEVVQDYEAQGDRDYATQLRAKTDEKKREVAEWRRQAKTFAEMAAYQAKMERIHRNATTRDLRLVAPNPPAANP